MSYYDYSYNDTLSPECRYCLTHVPNTGDLCAKHGAERDVLVTTAMTYLSGRPIPDCIQVYPWDKAPEVLRDLSDNGGDEDWLAVIPPSLSANRDGYSWLDHLGCCSNDHTELRDGWVVVIGAHA